MRGTKFIQDLQNKLVLIFTATCYQKYI